MGTIMKNNINYSGGGSGASTAAAVSYNNTTSGLTSGNAQGAIDELAEGLASKADVAALDGKADRLTYNESSSTLLLQSGGVTLSSVHIEGGSIATIVHVQTHEQSWWNNPAITIDVKDSDENINNGHFDANGDYVVKVHHLGTYTVTVTDDQGHKYVTTFEDNQLGAVLYVFIEPYGWEGWLNAASMATTAYSSLEDVLADEKALRELFTKHASVDYLVTWLSHADTVTSVDEVAHKILDCDLCAKWINLRDYALDMLYANTVIKAIMDEVDKYGYGEWALLPQVPKMTSNTAPYGEASASSQQGEYRAYKLFDGQSSQGSEHSWSPNEYTGSAGTSWIQYKFTSPTLIKRIHIVQELNTSRGVKEFEILASNNGTDFETLGTFIAEDKSDGSIQYFDLVNNKEYLIYRLHPLSTYQNQDLVICQLQFYAWGAKGAVPVMTSDSAPYGQCISSTASTAEGRYMYMVFDGKDSTWWSSTTTSNSYIGYKFVNPICARRVMFRHNARDIGAFKIEASNDNSVWTTLYSGNVKLTTGGYEVVNFDNNSFFLYYRLFITSPKTAGNKATCFELQFYGRQLNVSVPVMTSNTAPWGEAFASSNRNNCEPYKAFNGIAFNAPSAANTWASADGDVIGTAYVGYEFNHIVCLKGAKLKCYRPVSFIVQAYIENEWKTVSDKMTPEKDGSNDNPAMTFNINVVANKFRLLAVENHSTELPNLSNVGIGEVNFYGVDYSEREFEEGSTMKYIYDHGVELEPIYTVSYGATVTEKRPYELYLKYVGTSKTEGFVVRKIDASLYKIMRAFAGSEKVIVSNYGNWLSLRNPVESGIGSNLGYTEIKDVPFNVSMDISSINQLADVAFYNNSGYDRALIDTITEWWLE